MQRRLATISKRFPTSPLFAELHQEVEQAVQPGEMGVAKKRHRRPELILSLPRPPMELFRKNQLRRSIRDNIRTLAQQKKLSRCFAALRSYWQENGFQRDLVLEKVYDRLAKFGRKKAILGMQRREIARLSGPASFVHYNPTTAKLACVTNAGYFRLITLARKCRLAGGILSKGDRQQSFTLHAAQVTAMTICPSGSFMAIGLADGRILLRSMVDKKSIKISMASAITTLLFSSDNRWLAAAAKGEIIFYDLVKGQQQRFSIGATATAMAMLPDSLNFCVACVDGSLQLWDFGTKKKTREIDGHVLAVTALALNASGSKAVTAGEDRMIRIWDMVSGGCLQTIEDRDDMVTCTIFGQDDFSLISGSDTDLVKSWDLGSGKNSHLLDGRGDGMLKLIPGPDSTTFISSSVNGSVLLWKIIYDLDFDL